MDDYKVSVKDGFVLLEHQQLLFKVKAYKDKKAAPDSNTAVLEATLYKEEGTFVQAGSYLFQAVDKYFEPINAEVNIDDFKNAVIFFFTAVLNTDLFLISTPKASSLCHKEMKVFHF